MEGTTEVPSPSAQITFWLLLTLFRVMVIKGKILLVVLKLI